MLNDQIKCRVCGETEYVQVHSEEYHQRLCYSCADQHAEEEFTPFPINVETGKRMIKSPQEAKNVICATLKFHSMELDEIHAFKSIVRIAEHFKLDLSTITRTQSTDIGELTYGYPWIYRFEDSL